MSDNFTRYPPPGSGNSGGDLSFEPRTDFASLSAPGSAAPTGASPLAAPPPKKRAAGTDFASLKKAMPKDSLPAYGDNRFAPKPPLPRTMLDLLLDFLTPFMILMMMLSVLFFLLDWRLIYTDVQHLGLKCVSFFFILGVVALNRLIVRDGKDESVIYIGGFAMVVTLYSLGLTGFYSPEDRAGSVIPGVLDHPVWATLFNLSVVGFLWWFTNRLTHECCVDENYSAGDIGILTGTARQWVRTLREGPKKEPTSDGSPLAAVDPTRWRQPEVKATPAPASTGQRLSKRHPGISIFYFSVPVMLLFAAGLHYTQHGGAGMILAEHFYVTCYTFSALALLMLSSLGGLRQYFRKRRVEVPGGLGTFWLGLGTAFIVIVMVGASSLPLPGLPEIAFVAAHEEDPYSRYHPIELQSVAAEPAKLIYESNIILWMRIGVYVCLGLFLAYGGVRGLGSIAVNIARERYKYPPWLVRWCNTFDAALVKFSRLPSLPRIRPAVRVSRQIALSTKFANPLSSSVAQSWSSADHVEYAYDALCALAADMGVPRRPDQTPYEFLQAFPDQLQSLQDEARELTTFLVMASYAGQSLGPEINDRLRKFWINYTQLRSLAVR